MTLLYTSPDAAFVAVEDATAPEVLGYQQQGKLVLFANQLMSAIGLAAPPEALYDLRELVNGIQLLDIQRNGPMHAELGRWQRWSQHRVGRGSLLFADVGGAEPILVDLAEMAYIIDRLWLR